MDYKDITTYNVGIGDMWSATQGEQLAESFDMNTLSCRVYCGIKTLTPEGLTITECILGIMRNGQSASTDSVKKIYHEAACSSV